MSVWMPNSERNSFNGRLGIAKQAVEVATINAEFRREFEPILRDLYNKIGTTYGWTTCPAPVEELILVLDPNGG